MRFTGGAQAPARQAALGADLPKAAEAVTVNKMCGSGMQAAIMAHDTIKAGSADIIVAGGMENMTRAPYLLPDARNGMRMGDKPVVDSMMYDGLTDAYEGNAMGVFADMIAAEYQFSREQQMLMRWSRSVVQSRSGERQVRPRDCAGHSCHPQRRGGDRPG